MERLIYGGQAYSRSRGAIFPRFTCCFQALPIGIIRRDGQYVDFRQ